MKNFNFALLGSDGSDAQATQGHEKFPSGIYSVYGMTSSKEFPLQIKLANHTIMLYQQRLPDRFVVAPPPIYYYCMGNHCTIY